MEYGTVYESKNDAPMVESFIWDKICQSWGNFEGVKALSKVELLTLAEMCKQQANGGSE